MKIPAPEDLKRRFFLSCIACSVVSMPLALAGPGAALLVPVAWAFGAVEYALWLAPRRRRMKAAEAGLDPLVELEMPGTCWFYEALESDDAALFRRLAAVFLSEHPVTGVSGAIVTPRVLAAVASSAVMLVFGRPDWEYDKLEGVLVYPGSFADDGTFELVDGPGRRGVLGMAHGLGTVIMSLPHMSGERCSRLAVHEFAHVLDGVRGADGIPSGLNRDEAERWRPVLEAAMREGLPGEAPGAFDPPPSPVEFLASAAELFFCAPTRLSEERPGLYLGLRDVFRLDPASFRKSQGCGSEPRPCTEDTDPPPSFQRRRRAAPSRASRDRASRSSGRRVSRS